MYLCPQRNVFSFCNFRAKGIFRLIAAVGGVRSLVSRLRHILQANKPSIINTTKLNLIYLRQHPPLLGFNLYSLNAILMADNLFHVVLTKSYKRVTFWAPQRKKGRCTHRAWQEQWQNQMLRWKPSVIISRNLFGFLKQWVAGHTGWSTGGRLHIHTRTSALQANNPYWKVLKTCSMTAWPFHHVCLGTVEKKKRGGFHKVPIISATFMHEVDSPESAKRRMSNAGQARRLL